MSVIEIPVTSKPQRIVIEIDRAAGRQRIILDGMDYSDERILSICIDPDDVTMIVRKEAAYAAIGKPIDNDRTEELYIHDPGPAADRTDA
jgi:hypothetical protein